jgi:DNA-binding LytR/AlgR family response regulator
MDKLFVIKILVVEDNTIWQSIIEMVLSSYPQFKIIGLADSVENALEFIDSNKPDIIISDFLLAQDTVLSSTETIFHKFPTLFISSQDNEDCFNLAMSCSDSIFLVKPFHSFSFLSSVFYLAKHCNSLVDDSKSLSFRGLKSGRAKIKFSDIVRVEVEGNYSICFSSDGKKYARKASLNAILNSLDERFLRISKSTIVNIGFITKVDHVDNIVYINFEAYQVGRSYVKKLRSIYNGD